MNKQLAARIFGACFLMSFLSYGIGIGLMEVLQTLGTTPAEIITHKNQIATGGVLVTFLHTLFNIGLLVSMFYLIKPFQPIGSYFYLSSGLLATLLLALGGLFLMLSACMIEQAMQTNPPDILWVNTLQTLAIKSNFYAYQIGMAIWGAGGIALCLVLVQTSLVPKILPQFGLVGYAIFVTGTLLELFGYPWGLACSVPGGLFELALSIWLLVKGVNVRSSEMPFSG